MQFGVCIQSKIDDPDYVVRLEERGFDAAWFGDSPTIWSDCFACLAQAAERTTRIRLGTGVAVAGLRPPTTMVGGIATVHRLAPGRTFLGVGNGNTGWRLLGHRPLPVALFDTELQAIASLLRRGRADVAARGARREARFPMAELGFVDLDVDHPIPLVVSAFGPRSLALAARLGDGVVTTLAGEAHIARVRAVVGAMPITGLGHAVVLRPGEDRASPTTLQRGGATLMSTVHYLYDRWREGGGGGAPRGLADMWEEYTAMLAADPDGHRPERVHAGHNTFVHPDEQRFVTPERLARFVMVGTPDELALRLRAYEAAGLDEVLLLPDLEHRDLDTELFANEVIPRLRGER